MDAKTIRRFDELLRIPRNAKGIGSKSPIALDGVAGKYFIEALEAVQSALKGGRRDRAARPHSLS